MAIPGFQDTPGATCHISAERGTTTTASVGAGHRADAIPGGDTVAALLSISAWRRIVIAIPFALIHTIRGRWWRDDPVRRRWFLSIVTRWQVISPRRPGIAAVR